MRMSCVCCALALISVFLTRGGEPKKLGPVEFKGDISKSKNISGVTVVGDFLVIGSDEGNMVQVLERDGDRYTGSVISPNQNAPTDSSDEAKKCPSSPYHRC
jgi:hypothetical protein